MSTALALSFAEAAHRGQVRKFSGEPYIRHPERVADLLRTFGYYDRDDLISAAYLHDVLEDTGVTYPVMEAVFGDIVTTLVVELTKPNEPRTENAKLIKCADIMDNASTIVLVADADYARTYLREKWEQLAGMFPEGPNSPISAAAFGLVQKRIADEGVE